jgi:HAMP domain-containing protein
MTLRTRSAILICSLMTITVLATVLVITTNARQALEEQTEVDGRTLVQQFIHALAFGNQVQVNAETNFGEDLVLQAKSTAHLVSIAETAGLKPDEINAHLRDVAGDTPLEFWITDDKGRAYLKNRPDDFTFSQDGPSRDFWSLLTGEQKVVIQKAQPRPGDQQFFKYVGVAGIDKPRIVQVGFRSDAIGTLQQPVWLGRMVDNWLSAGNVNATWIVDKDLNTLSYKAVPGLNVAQSLSDGDKATVQTAVSQGRMISYLDGDTLKVIAPSMDVSDQVSGAVVVYLPTDRLQSVLDSARKQGVALEGAVLVLGLVLAIWMTSRVTGPAARLTTAARSIEDGDFDPDSINDLSARTDELGQLSRVFQKMAREVYAREQRLKQQVQELRIEIDETRRTRQVAEVTETEYFQDLQKKAKELRARAERSGE